MIVFAIPGGGLQTIAPINALPTLTRATVVDATTQPGHVGSPLIVLDDTNAAAPGGGPATGLAVTLAYDGTGSAVRKSTSAARLWQSTPPRLG